MTQTRDVLPGEELNVEKLQHILSREGIISRDGKIESIRQFSQGYSNLTYLIETNEDSYVLRKPPVGATKRGHDMGREYKVISGLYPTFNKVPKPFYYGEDEAIGSSFYIMEKVDGIILNMDEANRRSISEADYKLIADTWMDGLVQLHQLDYRAVGLEDLGKPEGYVERQVRGWSKQYLKAATEDLKVVSKVMAWLDEHQPSEYDHALIHNDYKYDNVVFVDDTWKELRAILDWEMCTLGDPLMDLGASLSYWTMASDGPLMMSGIPSPTIKKGNPGRQVIVGMYEKEMGKPVQNLVFYYVFGLFKLAVIAQQIYYRFHHGMTHDRKFARLEKAAEMLCTVAVQAIHKKRIEDLF